ncbi:MAG: toxin [Chlorobi bacterium]|nr:toxin [Chlorobiota bacterium]
MKKFSWNSNKNIELKIERGISFEIILSQIEGKKVLDIIEHTNKEKYPNQKIFIVEYNNYAYLVPFVESSSEIFLKTIIPSRKMTKKYIKEIKNGKVK